MAQHTTEIRYGGCDAFEGNLVLRFYTVYLGDISMLHPTQEPIQPIWRAVTTQVQPHTIPLKSMVFENGTTYE